MSEIRVDTITEKTSANGVAIDSVTLKDGGATLTDNITFSASGKGVHLGVTTATASNLLDDYEEGTWTPANGQVSLSVQSGIYVKVGDLVWVQAYYNMPSTSDTTGHQVTGLPFTVKAEGFSFCATRVGGESSQIVVQLNGAATTGDFYKSDDTAPTNANLSSDYVLFSGCYRTA